MAGMTRLFTAIDLSDEIKNRLLSFCTGVPGAKRVKREQMHLTLRFIASRTEPAFNLPLLRGRGQLLELNSADLRFTAIEVEQFLTDVMRLQLAASDRT
jgi:hypothetical protein